MSSERTDENSPNVLFNPILGVFLSVMAVVMLISNERDAVRQTSAISEISKEVIADVPSSVVKKENDGKLVHMTGTAITRDVLEYEPFGIRENALRLRWETKILQWEEEEHRYDGGIRYSHSKNWVKQPVDSRQFERPSGHSNLSLIHI